ncbi:hypothetical protein KA012_03425, partial [Candidatus Woesebacteria bacterium]|nr:hypothetical protein [Candidatus Woesebacteria bacterium]
RCYRCGGPLFHAVGRREGKRNSVVEAGLMVIRPASTCLSHGQHLLPRVGLEKTLQSHAMYG